MSLIFNFSFDKTFAILKLLKQVTTYLKGCIPETSFYLEHPGFWWTKFCSFILFLVRFLGSYDRAQILWELGRWPVLDRNNFLLKVCPMYWICLWRLQMFYRTQLKYGNTRCTLEYSCKLCSWRLGNVKNEFNFTRNLNGSLWNFELKDCKIKGGPKKT